MTVFIATKPVDLSVAGFNSAIAGILGPTAAPYFEQDSDAEYEVRDTNSTVEADFQGSGFTPYDTGIFLHPVFGVINALTINTNTGAGLTTAWQFTGMSVPAGALQNGIETGDFTLFLQAIFQGNDSITGSTGNDILDGFGAGDQVFGLAGNDALIGLASGELLNGGGGKDHISAPGGNATMTGGAGADTFIFNAHFGRDAVTDFAPGTLAVHDTIRLISIPGLHTFAQVDSHAKLVGHHVVIHDNSGDTITLSSVHSKAALHAFDFHFH
jgi:hypothetical protein